MADYLQHIMDGHYHICDNGATNNEKGRAFEDLTSYLFELIPGVELAKRNENNFFESEEVDVAFWNNKAETGLWFLPNILLIECKNWSVPVGSRDVNWFCTKVENRGLDFGILIAANGVTGNADDLNAAHQILANHLRHKRQIIVITRHEINNLQNTDSMVRLIKEKLTLLAVGGRIT